MAGTQGRASTTPSSLPWGRNYEKSEADVIRLLLASYVQFVQLGSISKKINGTFERIIPPALKHDVFSK